MDFIKIISFTQPFYRFYSTFRKLFRNNGKLFENRANFNHSEENVESITKHNLN